jgi:hypothetical protein
LSDAGIGLATRYRLDSSIAGRSFEPLQVDVTIAAPDPWDAQPAQRSGLLAELGLDPIELLLVPLERQVAEKLHAYLQEWRTTRARDLIDLLLVQQHERLDPESLLNAIRRVFSNRATHGIPERLPLPPGELSVSYRKEAAPVEITADLTETHRLLAAWLDPILGDLMKRTAA